MVIACALGTGVLQADATHEVTFSVDRHYIRSSWDRTKATGRGACGDLDGHVVDVVDVST